MTTWNNDIPEKEWYDKYWDKTRGEMKEIKARLEMVDNPEHYQTGGIETIHFIRAKLGKEGFTSYCVGNVLKYASRWQEKGGVTDLAKAAKYAEWAAKGEV